MRGCARRHSYAPVDAGRRGPGAVEGHPALGAAAASGSGRGREPDPGLDGPVSGGERQGDGVPVRRSFGRSSTLTRNSRPPGAAAVGIPALRRTSANSSGLLPSGVRDVGAEDRPVAGRRRRTARIERSPGAPSACGRGTWPSAAATSGLGRTFARTRSGKAPHAPECRCPGRPRNRPKGRGDGLTRILGPIRTGKVTRSW